MREIVSYLWACESSHLSSSTVGSLRAVENDGRSKFRADLRVNLVVYRAPR